MTDSSIVNIDNAILDVADSSEQTIEEQTIVYVNNSNRYDKQKRRLEKNITAEDRKKIRVEEEKGRRNKINVDFINLEELLPETNQKMHKSTILKKRWWLFFIL
ncbi:16357_t:CDS:2 [Dentiscutata heterogama]|uniref:16357_t:CDS:1 n=1 Tax=Dentiscutata heterogama TaxID=1316150 RepID=A0ACA9JZS8_9GLOM|nr:16357_t:CDS:2 [Dentiscutata heterogama]